VTARNGYVAANTGTVNGLSTSDRNNTARKCSDTFTGGDIDSTTLGFRAFTTSDGDVASREAAAAR
jgi:hypothetical protein